MSVLGDPTGALTTPGLRFESTVLIAGVEMVVRERLAYG